MYSCTVFAFLSSLMMIQPPRQNDPIWLDQQSRNPFYNKFHALGIVSNILMKFSNDLLYFSSNKWVSIYLYKKKSSHILIVRKKRIVPFGFLLFEICFPGVQRISSWI